jgi:hypothetical protein
VTNLRDLVRDHFAGLKPKVTLPSNFDDLSVKELVALVVSHDDY